jgi:hypothetical protein
MTSPGRASRPFGTEAVLAAAALLTIGWNGLMIACWFLRFALSGFLGLSAAQSCVCIIAATIHLTSCMCAQIDPRSEARAVISVVVPWVTCAVWLAATPLPSLSLVPNAIQFVLAIPAALEVCRPRPSRP